MGPFRLESASMPTGKRGKPIVVQLAPDQLLAQPKSRRAIGSSWIMSENRNTRNGGYPQGVLKILRAGSGDTGRLIRSNPNSQNSHFARRRGGHCVEKGLGETEVLALLLF